MRFLPTRYYPKDELKAMFNTAIDAIRANGKYEEINKQYFAFDVFGS